MADRNGATFSLRGLDFTTPGHQLSPGTCRTLKNLVPVGRGEDPVWEVPRGPADQDVADLVGVARHSEQRLLGLREDELVVIDPANGYSETQVWSFTQPRTTRRMTTARLGADTIVAVTCEQGCGRPEQLLWVRDETAGRLSWPPLPSVSLSWSDVSGDALLENHDYVFRFAWELENGSIGPSSGPIVASPGSDATNDGWEVEFVVEEYTRPVPDAWWERLDALRLIVQAPLVDDNGDVTTAAIDRPGRLVARTDSIEVGTTLTYSDSASSIEASEVYEGIGLSAHERRAGAVYSYNKRLMLGDVGYDLERPNLRKMIGWEEGTSNANGDDWHAVLRVRVETPTGPVTRFSEVLPFDTDHAEDVATQHGYFWYRDARGIRWDLFSTDNYQGSIGDTEWKRPVLAQSQHQFLDSPGAGYVYAPAEGEPYDITSTQTSEADITDDEGWTAPLSSDASAYDGGDLGEGQSSDSPHTADLALADFLGGSEDLTGLTVEIINTYTTNEDGPSASALASGEVTVQVLDGGGTVVEEITRTAEGQFVETLSFQALSAGTIRVETSATASASATGDDSAQASANVRADTVSAETSQTTSETVSLNGELQQVLDRDGTRIVWSETHRPIDLPASHLVYAGEDDQVLALQATGQEVSAAQFGEYPILVFCKESVRILQIGTAPFVRGVDLLTADMGVVGRRAVAAVDGAVVAALDGGVYHFTPQLDRPALSAPLEDPNGDFLAEMGPDTAVGHYKDASKGRSAVWVSSSQRTYRYDTQWGAWSTRPYTRTQFALWPENPFSTSTAGALVRENDESAQLDVKAQTSILRLGLRGYFLRIYEVQAWMVEEFDTLTLTLVATNPDEGTPFVVLADVTLDEGEYHVGMHPKTGLAPDAIIDLDGQGTTGQQIEDLYIEMENRHRRLRDHQAHPQTALSPGSSLTWD